MEARIALLEARLARRSLRERVLMGALAVSVAALIGGAATSPDTLTLKRLTIVDEAGTPRMMIGSHLPDPPMMGRRVQRGQTAHGILLLDADGTERGSMVTFDETGTAMVSLDNVGRMAVQLAASPTGGARLWMRDAEGADVKLGAYTGGPYLRLAQGDLERMVTAQEAVADAG